MAVWHGIRPRDHLEPIGGWLLRVVESQEQVATLELVDTLGERSLLEELLEQSKPATRSAAADMHYLLATPFRYPPLRHGSRFGARHQPAIFYGAHAQATALAEAAYYRLVFWSGMETPPPRPIRSQHTLFRAPYGTADGLKLHQPPFDHERSTLIEPARYTETQALGTAMRQAGALAFEFISARDPDRGINIGLFEPAALASNTVTDQQQWLCQVDSDGVQFLHLSEHTMKYYPVGTFLSGGRLPTPAV